MNCVPINDRPEAAAAVAEPPSPASRYALANLVRYVRHGAEKIELSGAVPATEVMFIDDDTQPSGGRDANLPSDRRPSAADVLYIGPE